MGPPRGPTRGAALREAAEVLGISKEAVGKRVKRGTLRSEKGADGRVYVYLPAGAGAGVDAGGVREHGVDEGHHTRGERDDLIAELRAEVAAWREESRRKDHIIAGLVERLPPQLEAPASPAPRDVPEASPGYTDAPEGVEPRPVRVEARPATEGAPKAAGRRSWWRRLFGG